MIELPSDPEAAKKFREKKTKEDPNNIMAKSMNSLFPQDEIMSILKDGDPLAYILGSIAPIHVGDSINVAWHILSGVSSGFNDRKQLIHLAITGNSGKGKSSIQDHVGLIFENIETVTSSSTKSQFYKAQTEHFPDKGVIRFDEAEGSEDALILERALTDKSLSTPTHDTLTTDRKFQQLKIPQINAVWKNSVNPSLDEQLMNRYIILNVDESLEQDLRVAIKQIDEQCYDKYYEKETEEIQKAKLMISKIKEESVKIIIPYGYLIEASDNNNRRSLPKFLTVVKAVTYIYRFQRPSHNGYIFSSRKDFEIAQLLWEAAAYSEKTHTNKTQQAVLAILSDDESHAMERKDIAKALGKAVSTVSNYLAPLLEGGLVSYKEDYDGTRKKLYWRVKGCQRVSFSLKWQELTVDALYDNIKHTVNNIKDFDEYKFYNSIVDDSISSTLLTLLGKQEKTTEEGVTTENKNLSVSDSL